MSEREIDLIQGTLNVLILQTLARGANNGYGIASFIRHTTEGDVIVEEGALYPALHRMEHRGWIRGEWRLTENKRRAKVYHLTAAGRAALRERVASWKRLVRAVGKVLAEPARA